MPGMTLVLKIPIKEMNLEQLEEMLNAIKECPHLFSKEMKNDLFKHIDKLVVSPSKNKNKKESVWEEHFFFQKGQFKKDISRIDFFF